MNIFTYFPKGKNNLNSLVIKIHNFNLINNKIIFLDDNNLKKYNINSKFFSLSLKNKIFLIKFIILSQEGGFFFDIGSLIIKNLDFLHNKFISADKNLYYDNEELNGVIFMKKDTNLLIKINEFINNTNDLNIIKKNIIKFIKNYYTKSEFIKNTNSDYFINIDNQICKKKFIFENKTIQKFKLNNIINKKNFFYFNLPIIYKLNNNNIIDFLLNNENSIFKFLLNNETPKKKISIMTNIKDQFLLNNETPKKKISIMTNIKDELDLQEWICYYIYILKFDYIFIYDNGSENSVHDLVNKYFQGIKEKIYVIYFPGPQIKPKARLHYNKNYLHLSGWTLFIDGDEYLCLKEHEDIHEFINQDIFIGVEQISINWLFMGTNGLLKIDKSKLVIEKFTEIIPCKVQNSFYKVLVRNKSIIKDNYTCPHYLITKNNYITDVLKNKVPLNCFNKSEIVYNTIIFHYHYKSKEEWEYKCDIVRNNFGSDDGNMNIVKRYSEWPSLRHNKEDLFLKNKYTNKLRELIYGKNNLQKNINYLSKSLIEKKNIHSKLKNIHSKLKNIHSKLKINYGSFQEELSEQIMVVRYLNGQEKVLEIGGNIGRNSLVIASILDDNNLVTLESDINISKKLTENRDLNNMNFYIESSALSSRKLIQCGWDTKPSETIEPGFKWVNTITFSELKTKYNIEFDTLVLDCEGAFYYILMDMPKILNNIKLIIMENDYHILEQKKYIDNVLKKNNFNVIYTERGGWGPCYNNFFEVWEKVIF